MSINTVGINTKPSNFPKLMQAKAVLMQWLKEDRIRSVDWHLACQAVDYEIDAGNVSDEALTALLLAACSCSYVLGRGQVCIDVSHTHSGWALPEMNEEHTSNLRACVTIDNLSACRVIKNTHLVQTETQECEQSEKIGQSDPQSCAPLFILNKGRLYLSRYFTYEKQVLTQLTLSLIHI